ncbi:MarC family protein [Arcanobacterium hippocoleae]
MGFDLALFGSALTTLVVIVDPPGNLPIFMALTARTSEKQRRRTALLSNLIALTILLIFGFFGAQMFNAMGISTQALQISGGLLLLIISLQLLTGEESNPGDETGAINAAVVPLGTPLIAGPGGIVAFMLLVERSQGSIGELLTVTLGLIAVLTISWASMFFATPIMKVLGDSGLMLLTKLSGMLLAAIAVQLMIEGVLGVMKNFL